MLYYINEPSLEEAVEAYNNAPGNKHYENIIFLPVQEYGATRLAVVIIYTIAETAPPPVTAPTKRDRRLGPFIGQPPTDE